jgi:hypothetical protein
MLERLGEKLRRYAEKDGRGYPEWAVRYSRIARRIDEFGPGGAPIIEIGANASGIARFLRKPSQKVVSVDIDLTSLREAASTGEVLPVMADAARLPFSDGVAGACVCVDTFEHLSELQRMAAANEILRVTAGVGIAVVAFPSGPAAEDAERFVRDEYRRRFDRAMRWLEEHREMGLPDADAMFRAFSNSAGPLRRVALRKNAPISVSLWMWRILLLGWPGRGNAFFQALLRLFTPLLIKIRFGECYRTEVWIEPRIDNLNRKP